VTVERLLGPSFFPGKSSGGFQSREEWEAHKADLQKVARAHSKILRQLKAGKKKGTPVMRFPEGKKEPK